MKQLKKTHVQVMKDRLLTNPFPITEADYHESQWGEWEARIQKGKESDIERIEELAEDYPEDFIEDLAEDIHKEKELSNSMYAVLTVKTWSNFESFFANCIKAWNLGTSRPVTTDTHKIRQVRNIFRNEVGIPFENIRNEKYINAVRVLANTYKHNSGRYKKPGKFPIDEGLTNQWGIEENDWIDYSELPIKEIVMECGKFCEELLTQLHPKVKYRIKEDVTISKLIAMLQKHNLNETVEIERFETIDAPQHAILLRTNYKA